MKTIISTIVSILFVSAAASAQTTPAVPVTTAPPAATTAPAAPTAGAAARPTGTTVRAARPAGVEAPRPGAADPVHGTEPAVVPVRSAAEVISNQKQLSTTKNHNQQ